MLAYVIINRSIAQEAVDALDFNTGELITVPMRDPVYETRNILDEDGNPTGETYEAFIGFGEVYEMEVEKRSGGYALIGKLGQWYCLLMSSSANRLQTIATQAGDNLIPLVTIENTEDGDLRWKVRISTQNVSRINVWLDNNGYPTIPGTWTYAQVVRDIIGLFAGEKFDIKDFSILGSSD